MSGCCLLIPAFCLLTVAFAAGFAAVLEAETGRISGRLKQYVIFNYF